MTDEFLDIMVKIGIALHYAFLVAILCAAFTFIIVILWEIGWLSWKAYEVGHAAGMADALAPSPRFDPPL